MAVTRKRNVSLEKRKRLWGYVFLIPFMIGLVFFFLSPLIFYVFMAFSSKKAGMNFSFIGFDNFEQVLLNQPQYLVSVFESLEGLLIELVTIVLFSLFIAVLLNQRFKGRGFVRAIFFLPVVISSGVAAVSGETDTLLSSALSLLSGSSNTGNVQMSQSVAQTIVQLFGTNNVTGAFVSIVSKIVASLFDVIQKSGVQILIFLSGLQTISSYVYEAAKIDGSTGWETFWKITLPMISPMILVNSIYTAVDLLASMNNKTISVIYEKSLSLRYAESAAMGVMYLGIVLIILAVIMFVLSRFVYYEDSVDKKQFSRRRG